MDIPSGVKISVWTRERSLSPQIRGVLLEKVNLDGILRHIGYEIVNTKFKGCCLFIICVQINCFQDPPCEETIVCDDLLYDSASGPFTTKDFSIKLHKCLNAHDLLHKQGSAIIKPNHPVKSKIIDENENLIIHQIELED